MELNRTRALSKVVAWKLQTITEAGDAAISPIDVGNYAFIIQLLVGGNVVVGAVVGNADNTESEDAAGTVNDDESDLNTSTADTSRPATEVIHKEGETRASRKDEK